MSPRAGGARDLAERLADHVEALAAELLPGGHRIGAVWYDRSATGKRDKFALYLAGSKRGRWFDGPAGEHGDLLDLVRETQGLRGTGEAMSWARRWLGLDGGAAPRPTPRGVLGSSREDDAEERNRKISKAIDLWRRTVTLAGTQAERYLVETRCIRLGTWPGFLRYLPGGQGKDGRIYLPALAALAQDPAGRFVAIHLVKLDPAGAPIKASEEARTYIGEDGEAVVAPAKQSRGPIAGGAVRFGDPGPDGRLAVTEGIEDALSVVAMRPGLPVWAALGGNLPGVDLPAAARKVLICGDADEPGRAAAAKLARRLLKEGREARYAFPPAGFKDWNAALCAALTKESTCE